MVALFNAASGGGGGGTKVFQKGDQVMSYYEGRKGQKYPAVVVQSNEDGTYEIRFDDGDRESSVRSEHMTLNATKSGGGGGGSSSTTKKKKPGGESNHVKSRFRCTLAAIAVNIGCSFEHTQPQHQCQHQRHGLEEHEH